MEEDKLKKLIQQIEPDQPEVNFTVNLMKQIETEQALIVTPALKSLLNHHLIETPSINFTDKVMAGIALADRKMVYEPVISKKVWYGIGMAAALMLILIGFLGKSSSASGKPSPLGENIALATGRLIGQINSLPVMFLSSLFAVALLLLLDYFVFFKKKTLV